MSAVTASLCSTLMFVLFVSADQKIIPAESGQDVTLTCRAPNNNIIVVQWSRADLGDKYVLLYRDGQFEPANQHPSFKNRVDLQDKQMKDGDVSVILKDVTINDTGTYECGVFMEQTRSWELISIIHLDVVPPGHTGGSVVLKVGLPVLAVILLLLLLFALALVCIYNKQRIHMTQSIFSMNSRKPSQSGQDVTLTCRAPNSESEKMSQQIHQTDY